MLKIDLHIHSLHSGHAYGTIYDIIEEASKKNMKMIAITDHGPSFFGSAPETHFLMGARAPKEYKDVKVLWGCEANIINGQGDLDLSDRVIKRLDIILAQMHLPTPYKDLDKEKNTDAIIRCFKKYPIHIFSHPNFISYDYDFEKVCETACENNILLELNLSTLGKTRNNKTSFIYLKKMIEIARKHNQKIIINSDAHFLSEIGDDSILKEYWEELDLSDDIIINNYQDELLEFIGSKNE
ncbi:MAG: PHP domain-containing protein [Nanoarchaeota archaeon]|nr:PHP domain-containing protein [Nanoarchaeota archaeon]